jgi:hypothetical protein
MHIDFDGPYFDPALIGANGKLSRLHKGASKPPKPAPTPAPVRVEPEPEAESIRNAGRRNGLQDTILAGEFNTPTLGKKSKLGVSSGGMNAYGGEQ